MVPPLKDDENWTEATAGAVSPTSTTVGKSSSMTMEGAPESEPVFPRVQFSHIQIYVDTVDDLKDYKRLEKDLSDFSAALEAEKNNHKALDVKGKRDLWQSIVSLGSMEGEFEEFVPQNRDVIKQLMVGFGMRVTGVHTGSGTKSFLVTTKDFGGAQIVVTAKDTGDEVSSYDADAENVQHFDAGMSI